MRLHPAHRTPYCGSRKGGLAARMTANRRLNRARLRHDHWSSINTRRDPSVSRGASMTVRTTTTRTRKRKTEAISGLQVTSLHRRCAVRGARARCVLRVRSPRRPAHCHPCPERQRRGDGAADQPGASATGYFVPPQSRVSAILGRDAARRAQPEHRGGGATSLKTRSSASLATVIGSSLTAPRA